MMNDCKVVVFSDKAYNAIIRETFEWDPVETGGILLGHILDNGCWIVMEVLPPGYSEGREGDNVHHEMGYFEYNQRFVNYLANSVATQYKIPLELLGLWHRHPGSMDYFSSTDDGTNKTFASQNPNGAISGLVNVDPKLRMTMYYIRHNDTGIGRPNYLIVAVEVGSELIPEEYLELRYYAGENDNLHPCIPDWLIRRKETGARNKPLEVPGHDPIFQPTNQNDDSTLAAKRAELKNCLLIKKDSNVADGTDPSTITIPQGKLAPKPSNQLDDAALKAKRAELKNCLLNNGLKVVVKRKEENSVDYSCGKLRLPKGKIARDSYLNTFLPVIHYMGEPSKPSMWSRLFNRKCHYEVYSSIFSPAEVKSKSHMIIQLYFHLFEETEKVYALAQEVDKNAERRDYIPLQCKLKKGDKVDVLLNIYGESLLMSEKKSILWQGSFTKCSFEYFVPKDIDVDELSCVALLSVNGIPVGEMRFITRIVEAPRKLNPEIIAHKYNKVFISYAHKDEAKVKSFHEGLKLAGIEHFFDRAYLKTGDIFPQVIQDYINSADLFVLFWSENASKSDYVDKERKQALERAFPQVKPQQEAKLSIYPMSIEPRAELPNDMKDNYHFGEI